MDKHLKLLDDALAQAHIAVHELQNARPMDPRFVKVQRWLWVVRYSIDAAASMSVDLGAELARLKDYGVKL